MRAPRLVAVVLATLVGPAPVGAQSKSRQVVRVKIDSQPEQAAVYIDSREQGIKGYTPTTLQLPKGSYTVLLELPGFRPVQKQVTVNRSQGFMFTLERQARSAVIEVKSSRNNDSASGGQLSVDGTAVGTVPAKVEVQPGRHLVEIKKPGFADYREQVDVGDGGLGTVVAELQPLAKKG